MSNSVCTSGGDQASMHALAKATGAIRARGEDSERQARRDMAPGPHSGPRRPTGTLVERSRQVIVAPAAARAQGAVICRHRTVSYNH